jgi:uncharacterized protein
MPEKEKYLERIIEEVKKSLGNRPKQSISHRADHPTRVWQRAKNLAFIIMEKKDIIVDMEILEIACRVHDLDESYEGKKADHVVRSMVEGELLLHKVNYPKHRIQRVLQIISEHSSEDIKTPSSIEAKILFDADKLDGLGAIGIARVFALCGQQGLSIEESISWYRSKIKKAMPHIQTEVGREIAERDLRYTNSFLEKIEEEKALLEIV